MVFLRILLIIAAVSAVPKRVFMDNCDQKGFTCEEHVDINNQKFEKLVTFQCDEVYTTKDVEVWLYDMRAEVNMSAFVIQNCHTVTLKIRCSSNPVDLQFFSIVNVSNLHIITDRLTQLPTTVHFENIGLVREMPRNSFNQISRRWNTDNCYLPSKDLESVILRNVTIDVIRSGAFFYLEEMKEVYFSSVNVNMVEADAVHIRMKEGCKFLSHDSTYKKIEKDAMFIFGRKMITALNDYISVTSPLNNTVCLKSKPFTEN